LSRSDVLPPDVIKTIIIVTSIVTLVSVVLAAVDKAMDVGLRENDDDDVIDEARRGEGGEKGPEGPTTSSRP